MKLDSTNQKLLNIIQSEFPLSREPFADLGKQLNIGTLEVIKRIETMKEADIIRLIGPVFNPRRIGYQTTLASMKISEENLKKATNVITNNPMVSHCYLREHDLNLWFTLASSSKNDMDDEVKKIGNQVNTEITFNLPAIRIFKIGAYFKLGNNAPHIPNDVQASHNTENNYENLSSIDRKIINELQQDLPLKMNPYDLMSQSLAMNTEEFLHNSKSLIHRNIMRRYSASVNHNGIGFSANVMTCWEVPLKIIEKTGRKIARFGEVSHCYQRRTNSLWPYNLFAMIHASRKDICQKLILKMSQEAGIDQCNRVMLFSTREIKKTRIRYRV